MHKLIRDNVPQIMKEANQMCDVKYSDDELGEKQLYKWYKNNIKILQENYKIDFKK